MAIEIREIVIRAVATSEKPTTAEPSPRDAALEKEELIAACVKEVMHILRLKKER